MKWWFVGRRRWNASNGQYIYIYIIIYICIYIYINHGQYIASEPGRERQFCRVLGPQHRFTPQLKIPQRSDQSLPEITSFRQFQLHQPAEVSTIPLLGSPWTTGGWNWGAGRSCGYIGGSGLMRAAIYPRWVMISSGTILTNIIMGKITPHMNGQILSTNPVFANLFNWDSFTLILKGGSMGSLICLAWVEPTSQLYILCNKRLDFAAFIARFVPSKRLQNSLPSGNLTSLWKIIIVNGVNPL